MEDKDRKIERLEQQVEMLQFKYDKLRQEFELYYDEFITLKHFVDRNLI
jgi:archaellum component FlaC